jgi:hypothetical protein
VDVLVLSARYGLIAATNAIQDYEQKMTPERAESLKAQVAEALSQAVHASKPIGEIYVDVGRDYLPVLSYLEQASLGVSVTYAHGRIGERLRQLKTWLRRGVNVDPGAREE